MLASPDASYSMKYERRERHDVVRRLVIVEIVVVVLDEERRGGAEISAVDRHDLRPGGALEDGFVVAAERERGPFDCRECVGEGVGRSCRYRCQQVPIDLVAVGDEGLGLESIGRAARGGYASQSVGSRVVAAGAGVYQHTELRRPLVRARKGRQGPRLTQPTAPAPASASV